MKVNIDKYVLAVVVISVVVAFLTHFPELISLFDHSGENNLFPGMRMADVANEVFFTFISLLILFALNTFFFRFNRPAARITWGKMVLSFVLTWLMSNLLRSEERRVGKECM